MNLRSLSIAVPTKGCGKNGKGCLNDCMFCVSAMDDNTYPNIIDKKDMLSERDYVNRMNFCLERNFEALILTGTGEPAINMDFLSRVAYWNRIAIKPFRWIEIQTSGVTVDEEKLNFFRQTLGITTISLSLSNIFDSEGNAEINQTPINLKVNIDKLCSDIKRLGFNLRLSLNMWSLYNNTNPKTIFQRACVLGANQITFRILYTSDNPELPQNKWIEEHMYLSNKKDELNTHIKKYTPLEVVSFGATRYDVNGISTLVDNDCMSTNSLDEVRYMVLRPDCHLYTKWNKKASLLF